jgi:hypothetical protein
MRFAPPRREYLKHFLLLENGFENPTVFYVSGLADGHQQLACTFDKIGSRIKSSTRSCCIRKDTAQQRMENMFPPRVTAGYSIERTIDPGEHV